MEPEITRASIHRESGFPSGRIYENIVTNGGNVHFGDTYLLDDDTFRSCSVEQQRAGV